MHLTQIHEHTCIHTLAHNICAQAFYTQTTMPIVTGTEAQAQMCVLVIGC